MKVCNKCGRIDNPFGVNNATKDGLMTICKPCVNKRNKAYSQTKTGRITSGMAKIRWRRNNPKKYKAQEIVRKMNLPKQSCEKCGNPNYVVWHHDDYDKPKQVRPLCAQCHREWHCEHGEALNPI